MPVDKATERDLIQRLRAGEESAYRQAVAVYQAAMLRLARSLVGASAAQEVVQDTWLAVLRGLESFEARASLKTWLLTIVHNRAMSLLRRSGREVLIGDAWDEGADADRFDNNGHWRVPPSPWHEETPEALLASDQLRDLLQQALDALPLPQRSAVTLRDIEGLSMDEVGRILDVSAANARVLLHRGRTRLRQAIDRYQRGEATAPA